MTALPDTIAIPDPDDAYAAPIYDGPVACAHEGLADGTYPGYDDNTADRAPYTLTVAGGRAWLTPGSPA